MTAHGRYFARVLLLLFLVSTPEGRAAARPYPIVLDPPCENFSEVGEVLHQVPMICTGDALAVRNASFIGWGVALRWFMSTIAGWALGKVLDDMVAGQHVTTARGILNNERSMAYTYLTGEDRARILAMLDEAEKYFDEFDNYVQKRQYTDEQIRSYVRNMLEARIRPLEQRIGQVEVRVTRLEDDLGRLQDQTSMLRRDVAELTTSVAANTNDIRTIKKDVYSRFVIRPEIGGHFDLTYFSSSLLNENFSFVPFRIDSVQMVVGFGAALGLDLNRVFLLTARGTLYTPQEIETSTNSGDRWADSLNTLHYEGYSASIGAAANFLSESGFSVSVGGGYTYHQLDVGYGQKPIGSETEASIVERRKINLTHPFASVGVRYRNEGVVLYGQVEALLPRFQFEGMHLVFGLLFSIGR